VGRNEGVGLVMCFGGRLLFPPEDLIPHARQHCPVGPPIHFDKSTLWYVCRPRIPSHPAPSLATWYCAFGSFAVAVAVIAIENRGVSLTRVAAVVSFEKP
jgi:hypothetical protein